MRSMVLMTLQAAQASATDSGLNSKKRNGKPKESDSRECLDQVIVLSEFHLKRNLQDYLDYSRNAIVSAVGNLFNTSLRSTADSAGWKRQQESPGSGQVPERTLPGLHAGFVLQAKVNPEQFRMRFVLVPNDFLGRRNTDLAVVGCSGFGTLIFRS